MTEHARPDAARSDADGPLAKWADPNWTADGERRAAVPLRTEAGAGATTLWFNTGTLCNIACTRCYIESSPSNDRLVYLTTAEVDAYLEEIVTLGWPTREIGFTGGEPFLNPDMIGIAEAALARGHEALILTNAMKPMMRPKVQAGLEDLRARFGDRLILRVSLDHHTAERHDEERGPGGFEETLKGMRWLRDGGFAMRVAGRSLWDEPEPAARAGFARLFAREGFAIDAESPLETVIFPEMDETVEVPEITTRCWGLLGKRPESVMCASSRMVVKRKGAARPTVLACTLIPYSDAFDLGPSLAGAARPVALNHPHCAKFCVLGGASCSG